MDAVRRVLESRFLAEGQVAREFESKFAEFVRTKHAAVTSNGTTALSTTLEALDIQPGDEVITSPFTFIASANSIAMVGAIPIFVDVQSDSYNIDPEKIRSAVTEKTRAIMPVHIFGMPSEMKQIVEIAEERDLLVIEDACQAHGATIDGCQVGSFGDAACFSFYATKNMMTGEGGMITTNNDELQEQIMSIKNHGRGPQGGYSHFRIGYNNRMMDIVAALGLVQLKRLPSVVKGRRENAREFDKALSEIDSLQPQSAAAGLESSYHVYAPLLQSEEMTRDNLIHTLKEKGVGSRKVYALPCHRQNTYLEIDRWRWAKYVNYPDYSQARLPVSEVIGDKHFEIPVRSNLTDEERIYIIDTIARIFS